MVAPPAGQYVYEGTSLEIQAGRIVNDDVLTVPFHVVVFAWDSPAGPRPVVDDVTCFSSVGEAVSPVSTGRATGWDGTCDVAFGDLPDGVATVTLRHRLVLADGRDLRLSSSALVRLERP